MSTNNSLQSAKTFLSFSVDDLAVAEQFYGEILGVPVKLDTDMGLEINLPGVAAFAYQKDDHQPASFTLLNFVVADIDATVVALTKQGVAFEQYDGFGQDEKRIARGLATGQGPDIAWFKDPAGNILAVLQEK